MLFTVRECAELTGSSQRTVERALKRLGVYAEVHQVPWENGRGGSATNFIDPRTLGLEFRENGGSPEADRQADRQISRQTANAESPSQTQEVSKGPKTAIEADRHEADRHHPRIDMQQAKHRLGLILPILALPRNRRTASIKALAEREGIAPRTVYNWLAAYHADGITALGQRERSDKGALRLPPDAYQLVVSALIANPGASTRMLHRTLKRACDLAVSEATLRRIRERLLGDPHTRLLFSDADARKEHLRTYAGQVFAEHANQLWQLDMTRCDILVWDPGAKRVIRPRIHAIIDVYSGCIVSVVFSEREDQTQTDAAIAGALVPKSGAYEGAWPVFGTPERLYMDNGKTYRSGHVHRYLSDLGVEVVHSRPLVSHTRGKIERFFGTAHGYEKTMPGYCGANAKERATEELRRLTRNTIAWAEHGRDPGWGNRLLTLEEFRIRALAAILTDYHDTIVHGKSRLQHFLETAPATSQRLYSERDLMLALAKRTARVVNPDGSVRFANRFWTVESGELANYTGLEVLVLTNPALPDVPYVVVWQPSQGGLEIIGRAVLMPERADSEEARLLRANSKAAKKRELQHQTQQKRELLNPHDLPHIRGPGSS